MAWVYLVVAGIFEVVWSTAMKLSAGFSRPLPSIIMVVGMLFSFFLLTIATKTLPLGTAYAIWTGIGALGAVIIGVIAFQEPLTLARCIFLGFILIGILGLKISSH